MLVPLNCACDVKIPRRKRWIALVLILETADYRGDCALEFRKVHLGKLPYACVLHAVISVAQDVAEIGQRPPVDLRVLDLEPLWDMP
jgi:hypothetical protein